MPCIEGDTLRDRLNRDKQLPINDALEITKQMASALDYAHHREVVHRDIKPENILFHEGHAMVADFGIALAVKTAGGERLTETGLSLGTPAYMSPEQVAGDREIDGRSDIYSLACVLYEMLAGDPPFLASTPQAVLAKHVTDPAPPITTVRSSVPPPVASAIARALGKARADRFESAKAFSDALFAEAADAEPELKSIVVLPFGNLSPDPDNAFFADGLTEELIAELSGIKGLRVISRTSAMQFKDTDKSIPDIAGQLNVRFALEGSVRRAGDNVRITAQLIDGSDDSHLWAERYTGKLDDIFDLQEQLSRKIVEALRVALTPEEEDRLAKRPIDDFRAYDAWLRARQEAWKFTKDGIELAVRLIEEALKVAGDNALLHAGLGQIYAMSYDAGISHDEETLQAAESHAAKALGMDPNLGQAVTAVGLVLYKRGDLRGSARQLKRGSEWERSADALGMLGFILAEMGKLEDARYWADEAVRLAPLDVRSGFFRACVDFHDGLFDEAAARFNRMLSGVAPGDALVIWWLGQSLAHCGRLEEAKARFVEVVKADMSQMSDLSQFYCICADGDRDAATRFLEARTGMVETAKTDEWFPNFIATCLAMVSDEDGVCEWIQHAIDWGFCNYRYLEEYNPFLKPLHNNPRFQELVAKARQKHDDFDA